MTDNATSNASKDNAHIHGDREAFLLSCERARAALGRIDGVLAVTRGLKERASAVTDEIAILVFVVAKRSRETLPPDQLIPDSFEGYRTDVRVLRPVRRTIGSCNDDSVHSAVTGGIQIQAEGTATPLLNDQGQLKADVGTLGCIVQKRGGGEGDDNVYLLTNHHVVLDERLKTKNGDGVYHPYGPRTARAGSKKSTLLGQIDTNLTHLRHVDIHGKRVDVTAIDPQNPPSLETIPDEPDAFYIDCAAVRVDLGCFCFGSECTKNQLGWAPTIPNLNLPATRPLGGTFDDIDHVTNVRDLATDPLVGGESVFKVGRTTSRTRGKISVVAGPAHNVLDMEPITGVPGKVVLSLRYNVIEIVIDPPTALNCLQESSFSHEGDSGSLIVDERNRAVGLLYGEGQDPAGSKRTNACFIGPVLDALGMCIPATTGVSHGSSKALDGSGIALYGGASELPDDEDKVLFASAAIAGARRPRTPSPEQQTISDAQRVRMIAFRDALDETSRGRELHESFAHVRREIAYLVRRCRPVTVAWHRSRGPGFLAFALNHLKGDVDTVPHQIGGISRADLLARMVKVLSAHGSNPLRDAIERHGTDLAQVIAADTAQDAIARMRDAEPVGAQR